MHHVLSPTLTICWMSSFLSLPYYTVLLNQWAENLFRTRFSPWITGAKKGKSLSWTVSRAPEGTVLNPWLWTAFVFFKCLACSFVFVMVLDGHLSSCASCPLMEGGLKSLTVSFIYFLFRWDGVSVLFSCKRESLAFTFLFLLFVGSDEGRALWSCQQLTSACVHLSSVYIHSKLYMLVFFFFFK